MQKWTTEINFLGVTFYALLLKNCWSKNLIVIKQLKSSYSYFFIRSQILYTFKLTNLVFRLSILFDAQENKFKFSYFKVLATLDYMDELQHIGSSKFMPRQWNSMERIRSVLLEGANSLFNYHSYNTEIYHTSSITHL